MTDPSFADIDWINTEQLDDLSDMVGPAKCAELIEDFKKEIEKHLGHIFDSQHSQEEIAAELHTLKSCAASIGMARLAAMSRQMMADIEDGGSPDLSSLRAFYDKSLICLTETLAKSE